MPGSRGSSSGGSLAESAGGSEPGGRAGAGPKGGRAAMPPLRMQGLQGGAGHDGCLDGPSGRANGYAHDASASESEDAEYSDAFDEQASTGQGSRECLRQEDVFDRVLDAVRASHAAEPGAGPREPGPPRPSLSRESLRSGRSDASSGRQQVRARVVPPQGVARSSSSPAADVSYARGASAPALGARADYLVNDGQSDRSQGAPLDDQGPEEEEEEPQGELIAMSYPSYSWHETLARFPSLIRLYPLAECNEAAMEDELFPSGGEGSARADDENVVDENACPDAGQVAEPPVAGPELQEGCDAAQTLPPRAELHGTLHSDAGLGTCTPPPCTPVRVGARQAQATPRSAPSRGASRCRQAHGGSSRADWQPGQHDDWSSADLAAAWAEIDEVRNELALREREVAQREMAARRSEARNHGVARELNELRRRLDDYGEELENGVAALTAQQNALREERRQTLELQARARRMCATAAREDVVASKFREWDRRSWSPT